jgi:voltage-gated potassium channel
MSEPSFLERRLTTMFQKPPTIRAAGGVIVTITTLTVLVSALLMRVFDHSEFSSFGDAVWWALQTVTTVGYGDVVPQKSVGRIIGAIVMLEGIAFLTVVTAVITSIFIERARRERLGLTASTPEDVNDTIRSIDERLNRIEQQLGER